MKQYIVSRKSFFDLLYSQRNSQLTTIEPKNKFNFQNRLLEDYYESSKAMFLEVIKWKSLRDSFKGKGKLIQNEILHSKRDGLVMIRRMSTAAMKVVDFKQ